MMSAHHRFIYFFMILFVLLISVSCDIESKIKSDLRKISRDIKSQKMCDKNLLALKKKLKVPSLSADTLPNLKTKIKLYKLEAKLKNPLKKSKASLLGSHKLPLIPKLPVLPLFPPLPLHLPLVPALPLIPPPLLPLPLPLLPPPRLLKPLPLRLKKLKDKIRSQIALGSELKPVWAPAEKKKDRQLDKLKNLRNAGSLTNEEYLRFKKLLKL